MKERRRILVNGIVQGVGFRPFVYSLATQAGLVGQVQNDGSGVAIEVEGETAVINTFLNALKSEQPPLAQIETIASQLLPLSTNGRTLHQFTIEKSAAAPQKNTLIPADVATCDACLHELFDPTDRRYRYPFINCTNCGPRYTIIQDVPYDRPLTTMAPFMMCTYCQAEYDDPGNRRFHAQPNACPVCGPSLQWTGSGERITDIGEHMDVIGEAQRCLAEGGIVAVKGLGGYHLACDGMNDEAVRRLRQRKHRPHKPLALMAADLTAVHTLCHLSSTEEALLTSAERPIVLLRRRQETAVAASVAPAQNRLGIMLPYTPLHYLLFTDAPFSYLVMTSANPSGEPIVVEDREVTRRLGHMVDGVLSHNRKIEARCEDSVVAVQNDLWSSSQFTIHNEPMHNVQRVGNGQQSTVNSQQSTSNQKRWMMILRRGRGYAPRPLTLGAPFEEPVLAVGGHLKNSFCLGKGKHAFVSPHVGNLENVETLLAFRQTVDHLKQLFDGAPAVIAHDMHPDYLSTRYALEQQGATAVAVQHHHAHIASVMAEHHLDTPVIGIAFDGTGYGPDGTIWGGEVMVAELAHFERVAHLRPVPLPGGQQAIKQPWRTAVSWLYTLYGDDWHQHCPQSWLAEHDATLPLLLQMMDKQLNAPITTSMGRLFDAVAALLDVRQVVTYEGQAAIELEAIADPTVLDGYTFTVADGQLDPTPLFDELLADLAAKVPTSVISAKFHHGVATAVTAVCQTVRNSHKLNKVALSGGVFQNRLLLDRTITQLRQENFTCYKNQQVPANDGGITLGQAAIANAQLEAQRCA